MIALQEELDWETYRLYGLIDDDLTYGDDKTPGLALGERAFEIALAALSRLATRKLAWFSPEQRVYADHGDPGSLADRISGACAAAA